MRFCSLSCYFFMSLFPSVVSNARRRRCKVFDEFSFFFLFMKPKIEKHLNLCEWKISKFFFLQRPQCRYQIVLWLWNLPSRFNNFLNDYHYCWAHWSRIHFAMNFLSIYWRSDVSGRTIQLFTWVEIILRRTWIQMKSF